MAGAGGAVALTDGQIVGVMLDANAGEVRTAEVAMTRSLMNGTLILATELRTDHEAAILRLRDISRSQPILAEDSMQRMMVATTASQITEMLWMQPIAAFDIAFAQAQITLHTNTLNMLDTMLIPVARNVALRTELMMERTAVAAHLMHAQAMLAMLQGGAGAGGAGGGAAAP